MGTTYSQQQQHTVNEYNIKKSIAYADLVINSVKLGQDNAINQSWLGGVGVVSQGLVELGQLVHCFIAHQSLPNKKHTIRLVHFDQLGQGTHQWLIILHAPSCVHQAGIKAAVTSCNTQTDTTVNTQTQSRQSFPLLQQEKQVHR